MTKKDDFWQAYKHPLWQKKRLEILEAADWKCEDCGTKDDTLNVHHGHYEKGKKPWEYPNDSLHALCEACHALWGEVTLAIRSAIGRLRDFCSIDEVLGFVGAMLAEQDSVWDENAAIRWSNRNQAEGIAKYFKVHFNDLQRLSRDATTGTGKFVLPSDLADAEMANYRACQQTRQLIPAEWGVNA